MAIFQGIFEDGDLYMDCESDFEDETLKQHEDFSTPYEENTSGRPLDFHGNIVYSGDEEGDVCTKFGPEYEKELEEEEFERQLTPVKKNHKKHRNTRSKAKRRLLPRSTVTENSSTDLAEDAEDAEDETTVSISIVNCFSK